eukprot:318454-Pleurochrysis_carterae.AAC.1
MAVNIIDAVFPPNPNYFLHTLKHRPHPHLRQECDNARIGVVSSAHVGDHAGEHPTAVGSPLSHPHPTPTTR